MLYIVYPKTDLLKYMLKNISLIYKTVEIERDYNLIVRIMRKLLGRFVVYVPFLYKFVFDSSVYLSLKHIKENDAVLLFGCASPLEFYAIFKSIPSKCRLYKWFWNPLIQEYNKESVVGNLNLLKKLGYIVYTFDPHDAERYNINYRNQFGRIDTDLLNRKFEIKYDFYFMGKEKGRESIVSELQMYLFNKKYRQLFLLMRTSKEFISYENNILNILQSSCIIDIVQSGQTGLTLRPIESLFYRKKLLTNNVEVKKYDFYNRNNIFILGEDDIESIPFFLSSQYIDIPGSVISNYMIEEWIKIFE